MTVFLLYQIGGLSITMGTHRLWSHRSYKAKDPTRFLLMLIISMSNQGSIYHWVRDHRVHHRYSDTEADPHNINNGFFRSQHRIFVRIQYKNYKYKTGISLLTANNNSLGSISEIGEIPFRKHFTNIFHFL